MAAFVKRRAYRVGEVAEALGVSPKTVRAWIRSGILASVALPGARGEATMTRVPAEALEAFLEHA